MGDLSQTNVISAVITLVKHVKIEESVISPCCRQPLVYGSSKYERYMEIERYITMPYIHDLLLWFNKKENPNDTLSMPHMSSIPELELITQSIYSTKNLK